MKRGEIDSFISIKDDFFGISQVSIKTDIFETKDGIVIVLEIPGVPKGEINLFTDNGKIVISGVKKERSSNVRYLRVEREFGNFNQIVELPESVDLDHVEAEHNAGVLKITVPWLAKNRNKLLTRVTIK